jgi:hypothetical protein
MKKKLRPSSSTLTSAAAILAGGVLFTGPASAGVIFSENFEGVNVFGMSTYAYASNYTLPNYLTPGGGALYGFPGPGVTNQVSTSSFPLPAISLTVGSGVTSAQIDSGSAAYDFRGQFSSWRLQGDYSELSITFKNAADAAIGAPVLLGGQVFVSALASGQNPNYSDARAWGESAMQGIIPAGARTIDVVLNATKTAGGTAIDGYIDNFSLSVAPVPEPSTVALSALAGLAFLRRRRR